MGEPGGICFERFADEAGERCEVIAAIVPAAVDEEAGGAGDTADVGAVDIFGDS